VPGPISIDLLGERLSALSSCRDIDHFDSTVARQSEVPSPERALLCANGAGALLTEQPRPATNVDFVRYVEANHSLYDKGERLESLSARVLGIHSAVPG
jgi:hypothetical protein